MCKKMSTGSNSARAIASHRSSMRRPTLARLAFAFATLALVASFAAPTAAAAPGVRYGIADDAWLEHGAGTLESRLSTLDDLGVQIVRFTLRWDAIGATRPSA